MQWHYGGSNSRDFFQKGKKVQLVVIKYWFISLLTLRKKSCAALPLCLFLRSTHAAGTFVGTFTHRAVEAQLVILGGREREGSLLLGAPQGKWVPGSRGSPSSCSHCLEEARGSETRLPVTQNYLPKCDCACWEGHSRLCGCLCVHMKYIYAGFRSERVFVSQGLIFICCVSTRWRCSAEKLTQEILACPFKETAPKRTL